MNPSSRKSDINGWYEIQRNPLSKVGIFPYSGASIKKAEDDGVDPGKVYRILRPQEELSNPDCIASFKLLPWVDDHEFLGRGDGLTPAEKKGIHGATGENVFYEHPYLYSNIKVFSEGMKDAIENGKKELSCGYRCEYDMTPGVWNGQQYDGVQRQIRGNHLALVLEGRMGPDVAVLDHYKLTLDAKEFVKMDIKQVSDALDSVSKRLDAMDAAQKARDEAAEAEKKAAAEKADADKAKDEEMAAEKKAAEDKAKDEEAKAGEGKAGDAALTALTKQLAEQGELIKKLQGSTGADSTFKSVMAEVAQRDELVTKLVPHIGVFDHKEKTLQEVATYGADKLGLKPAKGEELSVVRGYLHNRTVAAPAMDAAESKSTGLLDKYS